MRQGIGWDESCITEDAEAGMRISREGYMEVKSSATYHPSYARHLGKVGDLLGVSEPGRAVVLRVDDDYSAGGVTVRGVRSELLGMPR